MGKNLWWHKQLNLIQYNLQIEDTPGMEPRVIASQLKESHTDGVILNAGGIYAWYESRVPFHHINEYLPKNQDLFGSLIEECHKQGIRVIARFDFSKTDDTVYLQRPEWFVKRNGAPVMYGKERMGNWSLLVTTCLNGGYRNEEFAVPVLKEVMERYEIDGIFLNAPHMESCFCENCKRKYKKYYGEMMPENRQERRQDWENRCLKDNIDVLYRCVKEKNPDIPVILYYGTYASDGKGAPENLADRYATADMICTEAQDILSAGKKNLPYKWKPTLNMKLGRMEGKPEPFGIIHSCPGMDWRHTGLPAAEYEFWMSQIPAAKGQLWHSLTGYEGSITDKRMLAVMRRVNEKNQKIKFYMESAVSDARTLLLWNAKYSDIGMTEGLMEGHIPFDVMNIYQFDEEVMRRYPLVLVPEGFPLNQTVLKALNDYVQAGGNLILEKTNFEETDGLEEELSKMLGICPETTLMEGISAAYGVWEKEGEGLAKGWEDTRYIPIKGNVLRTKAAEGTKILMTLIPPFAPLDGVGAPPERACMPVKTTDIPLIICKEQGKGRILTVFFELSKLMLEYGLPDQQLVWENCISYLLGEEEGFRKIEIPSGVYVYPYRWEKGKLIHLVNGVGERPLKTKTDCHNISFLIKRDADKRVKAAYSLLEGSRLNLKKEGSYIKIMTERLSVWDMIVVEWE